MSTELDVIRYHEQQAEVVRLYAQANNIKDIIKRTQLPREVVEQMLAEFKTYALQDRAIREKSREAVLVIREHYDSIIRDMYQVIQEAEDAGDYKAKITALKAIADIENQRINFLHKAGILVENELGEQVAETERKQQVLIEILRLVSKKHPDVGREIQSLLSEASGQVEGVILERRDA